MQFYTIGAYGWRAGEFFDALLAKEIDLFIDIRRRRAVRGSEYTFVNSNRLQARLNDMNIQYLHELGLAPTHELMDAQKHADEHSHTARRQREELTPEFRDRYESEILAQFKLDDFASRLQQAGTKKAVLFCVEQDAKACHRGIVAEKLQTLGYEVHHL
jgi:uncharacterized protein (DUF488 family)